ncbi:molybdate ABC transporter substrate-binding protein [Comamonas sp. CMM02]|uniref:molybdate ABC transporter substrate-binding protein n=1 Tax=Comamonas sp. CMM02 TaxID=2769307 RepID=UPI001781BACB|nr:molybdate ABC transporter substrate-binding protein [Comamonas sp. CMM02]MBD9403158.1 molybdate ABC transporter substrate-binding protein [Comamonas sp. CMM02]
MFRRLFLCCAALALAVPAMAADGVLVAAGAGYRKPVLELLQAFTSATGIKAEASFGNMKQVQAQQNPDISVLIGDRAFLEPMQLAQTFERLGRGQLVLVASKAHALKDLADLSQPQFQRIAVPDRNKAVYGKAAFTCLERSGLAAALQGKLLEVSTVPQVSAYLLTEHVDAGFVNATEAQSLQGKAGTSLTIAQDCYDPIELSMAAIHGRADNAATQALLAFIATPQARAVMQRHGL